MADQNPDPAIIALLSEIKVGQVVILTRLDAVGPRLDAIETRLARLDLSTASVRSDVMERADRLQADVLAIREDMTVTQSTAERAERGSNAIRSDIEDLRRLIVEGRTEAKAAEANLSLMMTRTLRTEARVASLEKNPPG